MLEKMTMTPKDILRIMKKGKSLGLKRLKMGDVEIEFAAHDSGKMSVWEKPTERVAAPSKVIKAQEGIADKAVLQEDLDRREQELDELLLSDPAEYERQIMAGELDDRNDDEEQRRREQEA